MYNGYDFSERRSTTARLFARLNSADKALESNPGNAFYQHELLVSYRELVDRGAIGECTCTPLDHDYECEYCKSIKRSDEIPF